MSDEADLPPYISNGANESYERKLAAEPPPPLTGWMRWFVKWMLLPPWLNALMSTAVFMVIPFVFFGPTSLTLLLFVLTYLFMVVPLIGLRRNMPPEQRAALDAKVR